MILATSSACRSSRRAETEVADFVGPRGHFRSLAIVSASSKKIRTAAAHLLVLIWPQRQCSQIATAEIQQNRETVTQFKSMQT